jgi:hypothetical protein
MLQTRLREAPKMRLKIMLEVINNSVPPFVVYPVVYIAFASD